MLPKSTLTPGQRQPSQSKCSFSSLESVSTFRKLRLNNILYSCEVSFRTRANTDLRGNRAAFREFICASVILLPSSVSNTICVAPIAAVITLEAPYSFPYGAQGWCTQGLGAELAADLCRVPGRGPYGMVPPTRAQLCSRFVRSSIFCGTLRQFFALRLWRPLPSCGRGIERNQANNAFARQRSQGVLRGNPRPKTWARYGHSSDSQVCLFVSNGAIHCPAFL